MEAMTVLSWYHKIIFSAYGKLIKNIYILTKNSDTHGNGGWSALYILVAMIKNLVTKFLKLD
jgi:hypothetical protein